MKIFRVLGLGLAIIVLRFLMPEVFEAFRQTLLTFFTTINSVLSFSADAVSNGAFLPPLEMIPGIPN